MQYATPAQHGQVAGVDWAVDAQSDRRTGLIAAGVVAGLALVILAIVTTIVIYSFSWGYAIEL